RRSGSRSSSPLPGWRRSLMSGRERHALTPRHRRWRTQPAIVSGSSSALTKRIDLRHSPVLTTRGRGSGRALLRALGEWFAEQDVSAVTLGVDASNPDALAVLGATRLSGVPPRTIDAARFV